MIEHRKFSLTCLGVNSNKFWNVTLHVNGDVESHYGRQGDLGQHKVWSGVGRSFMEKKIREKEKKGYKENKTLDVVESQVSNSSISRSELKTLAHKQIIYSSDLVKSLVEFLISENVHSIMQATGGKISYDTSSAQFKTTQGIVDPSQVSRARSLLNIFANKIAKNDWNFENDLNEYLSLIPRDFGRKRLTVQEILPNLDKVKKENDILDGLDASFNDVINNKKDDVEEKEVEEQKLFDVKLDIVEDGKIFDRVNKYFSDTKKNMHVSSRYRMKTIYLVTISHMSEAFENRGKKIGNIMELWHGTKCSNLLSILKHGLIIPPSSSGYVTGRMFGDGLYFSDQSTKSLNYATNFWGHGGSTRRIFMFLADVAMGKYFVPTSYGSRFPRSGYDSVFAKARQSGVQNNEMIVYNCSQANLKYLIEFN